MRLLVAILLLLVTKWSSSYDNLAKDCKLSLGAFRQGFAVNCLGGQRQNDLFIKHFRKNVLLPMVLKMALKTELCPIASQLGKYYTFNARKGRSDEDFLQSKSVLQQLSIDQLERLLQDLQIEGRNCSCSAFCQERSDYNSTNIMCKRYLLEKKMANLAAMGLASHRFWRCKRYLLVKKWSIWLLWDSLVIRFGGAKGTFWGKNGQFGCYETH